MHAAAGSGVSCCYLPGDDGGLLVVRGAENSREHTTGREAEAQDVVPSPEAGQQLLSLDQLGATRHILYSTVHPTVLYI